LSRAGNEGGIGELLLVNIRLFAVLANKTKRPSELGIGATESPFPPDGDGAPGSMSETGRREARAEVRQ
jgi:hypothetical protein